MKMVPVNSNSVESIGYEPSAMLLRVAFRSGGLYEYHGVPASVAEQFVHAPSKGKFYINHIKGRFNPFRIQ